MICRHCKSNHNLKFLDLGNTAPSNSYLNYEDLKKPEITYPLRIMVCKKCWLVQTEDYTNADELFNDDYAYFSSTSTSWLSHAANYCDNITNRLNLTKESLVVELASNDGYLLKNFIKLGVPCIGIEPTKKTAAASRDLGITVEEVFFTKNVGIKLAAEGKKADLIIGNNVYAHVPDINNFTEGVVALLKPNGVVTFEFPHLMELIKKNQFDTVYHEHFSYLSLITVKSIFLKFGLKIFDVDQLDTHGGSLRVYGCLQSAKHIISNNVEKVLKAEIEAGLMTEATYKNFQIKANEIKDRFIQFLLNAKYDKKVVVGYGAAAKGNTLINYAGIKPDMINFVCDAADSKIGKYLPGSHIPILEPKVLEFNHIDYLIIFPWNIADEIIEQNQTLSKLGTKFVTMIPELKII
tara:strand:- start:1820 stop:3043 length:1224 start_codon:yes stop_codon:yes gene_type:complete